MRLCSAWGLEVNSSCFCVVVINPSPEIRDFQTQLSLSLFYNESQGRSAFLKITLDVQESPQTLGTSCHSEEALVYTLLTCFSSSVKAFLFTEHL